MNFQSLLETIPYKLDELGSIPRGSKRWKTFLQERAEKIEAALYLTPAPPGEAGPAIAIAFFWALTSDVVLVAQNSSKVIVIKVPMIFDTYECFAQWLVWRFLVVCNHHPVDSDYVKNQLEGLRIKAQSLQGGEQGGDRTCMDTDLLDLL